MKKYTLYFAWLITCLAILVSLYFSYIRKMEPCSLCWYQRINLFPLGIILGIACYRGFHGIIPYVLPLTFIGMITAAYQVGIQEIPGWNPIELCGAGPNCTEKINIFGPITLPMLSFVLFAFLAFLLILDWVLNKKSINAHEILLEKVDNEPTYGR